MLLDAGGKSFARLAPVERRVVSLDSLPPHVAAAFLSVEDRRFYDHNGIDWIRVAGAALAKASRVGKLRRGTLEVTVANSTAMQEFTFERDRILSELNRSMPETNIRGLKFRVGQVL